MLNKLFKQILKKEPDKISIDLDVYDVLLMVYLRVNGRSVARMQCVPESASVILIGDIIHSREALEYNKGYGTMMMDKLIEYARESNYGHVYGNLAICDLDHKDRLHHFYQKFGFVITEYPEPQDNYYGRIDLWL